MSDLNQSLLLRALRRQPVERTPVWIMRQAGRYLPEYRAVRSKAGDFLNLCRTPELACEVALQPLRRFDLDAAILFSDILTIPDAMGLGLYFTEGEGPQFERPLQTVKAIQDLSVSSIPECLNYVPQAVQLIRREMPVNLPLIGFSGSPWTLACYMVEGKSSRDFALIKRLIETEPSSAHLLLEKLQDAVVVYLIEQIKAGVNVVMIFDTWGGILTKQQYQQFSLYYMHQIVTKVKSYSKDIPIILFTKGGGNWIDSLADTGCDAVGLDWTCDLGLARKKVGGRVALQGNLEPNVLLSSPNAIRQKVQDVLSSYGNGSGHIFNLGHGITPDVPPEHVAVMVNAVREFSPLYHSK